MKMPSAPGTAWRENKNAFIDYSNANDGYVMACCVASKKCRVQIAKGGNLQNFTIPNDAQVKVFPLAFGDGKYTVKLLEQIEGTLYRTILTAKTDVKLTSPLAPYLWPNTYAYYEPLSRCVAIASELCTGKKNDAERIGAIYRWIIDNVEYDHDFAARVKAGEIDGWWLPDPDAVITEGKTICFGYSSLFAAMCRSQGIPAMVIVGPVKSAGLHAWNDVYSLDEGKVGGVPLKAHDWTRLDLTFMDGGGLFTPLFVRNDANYSAQYWG